MYMKKFVDGGPAQQVTPFQPTFSPAQQGLGSMQQAPDTPAMESTPQDYNQSPQYAPTQQYGAPTQQYNAPAASPMTAGLGSYMEGLQYQAPPPPAAPPPAAPAARNYSWNSGKYADEAALRSALGTYATQNNYTPASVDTWMGDQAKYGISSTPAAPAATSTATAYNPQTQQYMAPTAPVEPVAPVDPNIELYGPEFAAQLVEIRKFNQMMADAPQGSPGAAGGHVNDSTIGYAQGGSIPQGIASLGRGQDSMLVHMTPGEVQGLQRLAMAHGGSLTINPQTGLPEAGFLSSMLPMLASAVGYYFGGPMGATAAGAITGGLTNKQSPLMGAVMGGISGYGMGSVGEGLSSLGADQAKNAFAGQVTAAGNDAATLALQQGTANNTAAIEKLVGQMGSDASMTPDAYRKFLTDQASSTVEGYTPYAQMEQNINTATKDAIAKSTFTPPSQGQAALQGLSSLTGEGAGQNLNKLIGQTAKDSATKQATGLGGGLAATMKGAGLAAPLISSALTPNKFVPPAKTPMQYAHYGDSTTPGFTPTRYNPFTGNYDPASYGPVSYSTNPTQYGAQGGAVGYAKGDLVAEAYYGEGVTTGGPGNPGKEPERSRDIYDDADVEVSQKMPYTNTKPDKSTPAKRVLAAYKATKKAKGLRALLGEEDDIEYAAEGGLMGTYAAGGKLLRGDGDGMSDSIPAVIQGAKPQRAALADGEFVIPADVVSHLGNGSTEAGSRQLYAMMDKIRKARTGNPKQGKQINPARFMPA